MAEDHKPGKPMKGRMAAGKKRPLTFEECELKNDSRVRESDLHRSYRRVHVK